MRLIFSAFVVATLLGCDFSVADAQESALIKGVPHVRQKTDFCGEACVASWLQKLGSTADQDAVFDHSGLDPALARGCYTRELDVAIRQLGFRPGSVQHRIRAANYLDDLKVLWQSVLADLRTGTPSIVCMRTGKGPDATEHFRLILGYNATTRKVIYHEPAADRGAYQEMPLAELIDLWPLKYERDQWLAIRFALAGTPHHVDRSATPTDADFAQHIMKLKSRLPSEGFTIVLQRPFVVIGDDTPEAVQRSSRGTVKWATDQLKAEYFRRDPNEVLDIWLFKDKDSYNTNAIRLFGSQPTTPYGYYSSSDGALVMNIATGGGTLVHEIVHPFIEANFPACPSWFNEGLGSLYEQSSSRDGRIVGMTNWRLAGLQRAIKANRVPSFATLCTTTRSEFYNSDPGTNYSQARYLCYYLQERGLLRKYYHDFVANQASDPTGYQTLRKILKENDMDAFKTKWETYVLALRF